MIHKGCRVEEELPASYGKRAAREANRAADTTPARKITHFKVGGWILSSEAGASSEQGGAERAGS